MSELLSDEDESEKSDSQIGKPQTIEEYNKELDDAIASIEAGEFYTHEEVVEMLNNRQWKKK